MIFYKLYGIISRWQRRKIGGAEDMQRVRDVERKLNILSQSSMMGKSKNGFVKDAKSWKETYTFKRKYPRNK